MTPKCLLFVMSKSHHEKVDSGTTTHPEDTLLEGAQTVVNPVFTTIRVVHPVVPI